MSLSDVDIETAKSHASLMSRYDIFQSCFFHGSYIRTSLQTSTASMNFLESREITQEAVRVMKNELAKLRRVESRLKAQEHAVQVGTIVHAYPQAELYFLFHITGPSQGER